MVTTNAAAIMAAIDEDVERWDAYEAVLLRRAQARLLGIKVVIPARAKAPKPEPVKLVFAAPATQPDGRAATWREVVDAIADAHRIDPALILAPHAKGTRNGHVVRARHLVMLALHLRGNSYPQIGRWIGGRDHSTALHAVRKMLAQATPDEMALARRVAGANP